jgi:tetratricopeptide (TPR) repeat protein
MRNGLILGCILRLASIVLCSAAQLPQTDRNMEPIGSPVRAILREASETALKQGEHERYWVDLVLRDIGDVQIRADDLDGALRTFRGSGDSFVRETGLIHLAEALARDGKRERAFAVLRLLDPDNGYRQGELQDMVQLQWGEHLIASGQLVFANKAIALMKSNGYHVDGLRQLAVAYARSGNAEQATKRFVQAVNAAVLLKDEWDRAQCLWEIAHAQLVVGAADAAKTTIHRLAETVEFKDPYVKVAALRESAVLSAKAKDKQTAYRLFRRAIESQKAVNTLNRIKVLEQIAEAQAGVGFLKDALTTALMIKHNVKDFTQDGEREQALCAIAVAQGEAGDAESAVRTALSIKHFTQYRDDALNKIVEHYIVQQDMTAALTTTEKFDNPTRRATAILHVATVVARSGDRKTAADIAGRIHLNSRFGFLNIARRSGFDYRLPQTWGVCYELDGGFTMSSNSLSVQRATDVAGAAMGLFQALDQKPAQSYAVLFNEVADEQVARSLARVHAHWGDANEALAWAKQIGCDDRAGSKDNFHDAQAVERRIHALIGVAEGILDRLKGSRTYARHNGNRDIKS